jgi:hypothetical protein
MDLIASIDELLKNGGLRLIDEILRDAMFSPDDDPSYGLQWSMTYASLSRGIVCGLDPAIEKVLRARFPERFTPEVLEEQKWAFNDRVVSALTRALRGGH